LLNTRRNSSAKTFIVTNTQVSFAKQFVFDAQQFLTIDSKVAATRKAH
jgi:hypothetical protein